MGLYAHEYNYANIESAAQNVYKVSHYFCGERPCLRIELIHTVVGDYGNYQFITQHLHYSLVPSLLT